MARIPSKLIKQKLHVTKVAHKTRFLKKDDPELIYCYKVAFSNKRQFVVGYLIAREAALFRKQVDKINDQLEKELFVLFGFLYS